MKKTLRELKRNRALIQVTLFQLEISPSMADCGTNSKLRLQTEYWPHKSNGAESNYLDCLQPAIQGAALALFVRRFGAFATALAVA